MFRTLSLRLAVAAMIVAAVLAPSALNAQKALVYCPVGIDAGGCTTIVAALNADATRFPGGADAGYDGTQGTLDLATTDFSSYAVFVVPSLADGPDAQPYALLRNGTIAGRLQAAFMGRAAVWSGTPDVGTTNRSSKDALIRNLAAWATSDAAGTHGPGVVALQDNSDDESARYGWLSAISAMTVGADTTFDVYSNVQVLTSTGQAILTSGGLQLGYTNMASYGLVTSGASHDATGARTSRVVLATVAGDASDPNLASVNTDKDDYQPGDTVTVTGAGWEPGETVSLLFHEDIDPPVHPDKSFTAVADGDGRIVNRDYLIDDEDLNVRFTLQATGLSSGKTAQATFTDAVSFQGITAAAQTPDPIAPGASATYAVTVQFNGNNTPTCSVTLSASGLPAGAAGSFSPNPVLSPGGSDQNTTLTITTNAGTTPVGTTTVTITGVGTGCGGTKTTTVALNVRRLTNTAVTSSLNPSLTGQSVTFTATVTQVAGGAAVTTGSVAFIEGGTCAAPTTVRQAATAVDGTGQVTFTTSTLNAGSHTIVGCYGGTTTFGASSGSVNQTVNTAVDLTLSKSHSGSFDVGNPESYALVVANAGSANTAGTVTVTDNLPTGLTFVSGAGTGWTCSAAAQVVTCNRTTAINAGANTTITLNVNVGAAAFPSVTNTASVSGGNEPAANNGNNSDSDPTTVNGADLAVDKSHTGSFNVGVTGAYSISVTNSGTAATSAPLSVTDALPTGLDFVSANGGGTWSCGFNSGTNTVTCTRASNLGAGNSAPVITVTVLPNAAAFPTVTNVATVSGGNEPAASTGNNSDSDPTAVGAGVDLTIDKSHTGNFTEGVNGTYSFTVSNPGGTATSASVTVTDALPTGLGFVSGGGTNGWNACTFSAPTVTCVRPAANTIAAGGSAPALTITVSVAAAAVPSVTNTASVAGGGEPAANNGNNSDSDPTTVIAGNQAPIVVAGGPYTGNEGTAIALSGASATDPDAGDTPIIKWTYVANGAVDAGTSCSFSNDAVIQPTFTCNDDGAFTLTLKVDDQHGHVVQENADVTVTNVKPTATAGGPYTGNEGSAIQLGGSGDDPAANDDDPKLSYKWTVNTTGIDTGGSCVFDDDTKKDAKITCTDDGAFKVSLVATDDDGAASDASIADLTVGNVNPVAHAGGPYSGNEGSDISLTGSATDAGSNDGFTYKWTADVTGIDAGGACTFGNDTHASTTVKCTDDGAFKVKLTVTDDDGGSHSEEVALDVANVDPVASAGGDYTGDEGSPVQLAGSATDVGSNDTFSWSWEAVNGPAVDAGATCSFSDIHAQNPTVPCTDDGEF
ncbi:MAG TPA: Ig-like domain repeat protein, partial [Gemmatimonadales bacterium]|nr:Ig-like domain repeat protein [Gemmatimonadales bacterium]